MITEKGKVCGIQTGTPTNPHANLSAMATYISKSGNVVTLYLLYTVTSSISGIFTTLCRLPWKPNETAAVSLQHPDATVTGTYIDKSTGDIVLGIASIGTGDIVIYGTYMTND